MVTIPRVHLCVKEINIAPHHIQILIRINTSLDDMKDQQFKNTTEVGGIRAKMFHMQYIWNVPQRAETQQESEQHVAIWVGSVV